MLRIVNIARAIGLSGVVTLLIFFAIGADPTDATLGFVIQTFGLLAFIRGYEDIINGSTNQGGPALWRKNRPIAFWITVGVQSFLVGTVCLLVGLWVAIRG